MVNDSEVNDGAVYAHLVASLAYVAEVDADAITPDSALVDLNIDSLLVSQALVEMELRLGRQIPLEDLDDLSDILTVSDVLRVLHDLLQGADGSR